MFHLFPCQNGRIYVKTRKMNVFVKPNEQCRACSNIVMARIGNRQHGALGEVERQNALFEERKRTHQFCQKKKRPCASFGSVYHPLHPPFAAHGLAKQTSYRIAVCLFSTIRLMVIN